MPHQLTIRYDDPLAREIDDLARREGISRNRAALRLLRKGAGVHQPARTCDSVGSSLDGFIGSWSDERVAELEEAITDFDMVEKERLPVDGLAWTDTTRRS